MKILILGGDGYCGWATALHLSAEGFNVAIVDNFSRRLWDYELKSPTLTPISTLHERLKTWERISGKFIHSFIGDITNWDFISSVIKKYKPHSIIHYAEQGSAPYFINKKKDFILFQINQNYY